jgi:hypothetical protein
MMVILLLKNGDPGANNRSSGSCEVVALALLRSVARNGKVSDWLRKRSGSREAGISFDAP